MRKEAGLIAIVLFLCGALLYFQNLQPVSQASLPASSAGATQDLNVSPPPPSTNINVPNSPSQNSSPTGGGQPNAASASDASCGPVVSSGSSQADYRTDQPHNSSYCATPSQPLSSLCSLSSIKLSISSPGAEEASAALAAGSTSCESPNVKRQNLCGKPCTFKTTLTGGSLSTEVTVSGECTKPNYCQGLSWTDTSGATHTIGSGQYATAGNAPPPSTVPSAPPTITPDKPAVPSSGGASPPPPSSQGGGGLSPTPPTTQPTSPAPATPNGGSAVQRTNSAGGTNTVGGQPPNVQPPLSGGPSPAPPVFNGNTSLGNAQPITPQNPFTPSTPSSGTGSTNNTGGYAITHPTFGGTSLQPPTSYVSPSSPLMNFVSSVGSLGSIFNFFTGLLSAAPATPSPTNTTVVQPTQIVGQPNPVLTILNTGTQLLPQITVDNLTVPTPQQTDQPLQAATTTPYEIATIVQGADTMESGPIIVQTDSGQSIIAQILGQAPQSISLNAAINLQVPELSTLALNTVNSLENYQNVPEQFYIAEANLAQAQSDYQWLEAQIAAWENAKQAGVCDTGCQNALAILESEVPGQSERVKELQTAVDAGPVAFEATSTVSAGASGQGASQSLEVTTQVPGAGQAQITANQNSSLQTPVPAAGAPYYTKQNNEWCDQYGQCIPENSFQSSPSIPSANIGGSFTNSQAAPAALDPITSIVQAVKGWFNYVVSLFTPNAPTNGAPTQPCSLFKSIFGGCDSGW